MEESLKYLLDAEQRAQEIVNKAIGERDRMLEKASEEVRGAEKRFKARIPGIRDSFLKKAAERADQTNAEILRRYVDNWDGLEKEVDKRRERAISEAVKLLLDPASG
ncbi:MAG: ATPase [Sedimenticolaceae bacterium]|nr:ATPase [Sedimenticolaceae bacterium]